MSPKGFPASGFVLVGGQSRRMGRNKALLELEGEPLFRRAARRLRGHVAEVTLLGPPHRYSGFGFPVLPDRRPGRGPLEGVCTGLASSPYEWNLFLACDLPLVPESFLRLLLERAFGGKADAVVPQTAGRRQPLCGVYHRRCLPAFERALEEAGGRMMAALEGVRVESLETDGLADSEDGETMFANLNTPHDWEQVRRWLNATTHEEARGIHRGRRQGRADALGNRAGHPDGHAGVAGARRGDTGGGSLAGRLG